MLLQTAVVAQFDGQGSDAYLDLNIYPLEGAEVSGSLHLSHQDQG